MPLHRSHGWLVPLSLLGEGGWACEASGGVARGVAKCVGVFLLNRWFGGVSISLGSWPLVALVPLLDLCLVPGVGFAAFAPLTSECLRFGACFEVDLGGVC